MSDLSPQSAVKRTWIKLRSPILIYEYMAQIAVSALFDAPMSADHMHVVLSLMHAPKACGWCLVWGFQAALTRRGRGI